MTHNAKKAAAWILCAFALGCAGQDGTATAGQPAADAAVAVSVQNDNWQDITVYALVSGTQHRLGTVSTSQVSEFVLPRSLAFASDLRIMLDPIGRAGRFVSGRLAVNPGDVIEIRVANTLSMSSVTVR